MIVAHSSEVYSNGTSTETSARAKAAVNRCGDFFE